MFAIVEDGSRQYRVQEGDRLSIDYREETNQGDVLKFERVLLANGGGDSVIGQPVIEGAVVEAEIIEVKTLGEKLEIQKIRRRKNSRRHTGHRQKHTTVLVKAINVPGLQIVEPVPEPSADEPKDEPKAETQAEEQTQPVATDSDETADSGDEDS